MYVQYVNSPGLSCHTTSSTAIPKYEDSRSKMEGRGVWITRVDNNVTEVIYIYIYV